MSDNVIDELHGDFLLCLIREEVRVRVLENDITLDSNGQDNHGHVEGEEFCVTSILFLELSLKLRNCNEKLLPVIHVQWQLIVVTKDAPVGKMSDKSNESSSSLMLQLLNRNFQVFLFDVGCFLESMIILRLRAIIV